jgi:hypothetical protein
MAMKAHVEPASRYRGKIAARPESEEARGPHMVVRTLIQAAKAHRACAAMRLSEIGLYPGQDAVLALLGERDGLGKGGGSLGAVHLLSHLPVLSPANALSYPFSRVVRFDQNLCWNAKPFVKTSDHIKRERALASQHLGHARATADIGFQVTS